LRRVFVLLLILGTMLGASPALAKQPGSSSSNHSFGHDRAIAIIARSFGGQKFAMGDVTWLKGRQTRSSNMIQSQSARASASKMVKNARQRKRSLLMALPPAFAGFRSDPR
jgi:hypothetical protein